VIGTSSSIHSVQLPRLELEGAGHIAKVEGRVRDRRRRDFIVTTVTLRSVEKKFWEGSSVGTGDPGNESIYLQPKGARSKGSAALRCKGVSATTDVTLTKELCRQWDTRWRK
jgi:hypothetical protein